MFRVDVIEDRSRNASRRSKLRMAATKRPVASDLSGLILTALTLFLLAALVSYNPADNLGDLVWPLSGIAPTDRSVYPENAEISNACGWFGALLAGALVSSLGLAAYLVALTPAIAAYRLMKDHHIPAPGIRSCGWTLTLIMLCSAFTDLSIRSEGFPVVGAGGCLGAMVNTWLHDHFAAAGAYILTLTLLVFGLLLWTDYVLVAATLWATKATAKGSNKTLQLARRQIQQRRQSKWGLAGATPGVTSSAAELAHAAASFAGTAIDGAARNTITDLPKQILKGSTPGKDEASVAVKIRGRAIEPTEPEIPVPSPSLALTQQPMEEVSEEVSAEETGTASDVDDSGDAEALESEDDEGGTTTLRKDGKHGAETPVRTPKQRKEERQSLSEAIQETPPAGAEDYVLPPLELLTEADDVCYDDQLKEVRRKAKILEKTFADFGFNVRVVEIETGPVIAQYEVELEAGLRLSKITGLADDLAIALRVPSVRIVAPIPGKNTVGIEVPNELRQVVRIREVIEEAISGTRKLKIPIFLGKDVSGGPMVVDLASMPHLLIAGRTGTGKSVCLNAIISSILMTRRPDEVRMLMIDPKMVELSGYGRLPHLMHPVVTDMRKAEAILAWAVEKMEERYSLLARAGVRHISSYNQLGREELVRRLEPQDIAEADQIPDQLPYIVIVADEIADLMMTAGKEVEQHIIRLAQKSRAVGIHLILATQKPTVDVITGLIKSNLPARICFQVASRTDSRVVLDENGADKLLGNGDMLFLWPGTSTLIRGQGTYLSDQEIESVVAHCSTGEQNFVGELMNLQIKDPNAEEGGAPTALRKRDDMYESAIDVVVREGRGSVSLLQRALGIGYGRAARLIDFMAEDGIVGEYNGSQAREVVISLAQWEAMRTGGGDVKAPGAIQLAPNLVAHPPSTPAPKEITKPKPSPAAASRAAVAVTPTPVASPVAAAPSVPTPAPSRRRSVISRGEGWDEEDGDEVENEDSAEHAELEDASFDEPNHDRDEDIPSWEGDEDDEN